MDFKLPELGEGILEAELVAWLVQPGERVVRGQKLFEVITDKASIEVPSPFSGVVTSLQGEPGEQIRIGQVVLSYTPAGEAEGAPAAEPAAAKAQKASRIVEAKAGASPRTGNGRPAATEQAASIESKQAFSPPPPAAPAVRQMARSLGIDLAKVHGSGPSGRILVEDLARHQGAAPAAAPRSEARSSLEGKLDLGTPGQRIKLLGLRRKIAEHMVLAKRTIPHYTYVDECEVTELVKLRKSLRDNLARVGEKTTTLAFYVKAAVAALKEVPIVNASIDEAAGEIVLHDQYHIGIATATTRGLLVPVIHNADKKSLFEVGREIEEKAAAARGGTIGPADLRGSTFTITSIGSIGGLITTPVINHPEAAILGIGKMVKRPVYDSAGNLRPADIVYLCISLDHRVVDGAVGAAFGNALCRWLQNPATLLLAEATA